MQCHFLQSINDIDSTEWNHICGQDYPFLQHGFFAALENSGSTQASNGWQPYHLIVKDDKEIVGIMPLFLKDNSYGEYVFDWAWADAYHRHGLDYYPKLINAIPFTPSTGPRWAIRSDADITAVQLVMFEAVEQKVKSLGLSSCHWLFHNEDNNVDFHGQTYLKRLGCQYHWLNQHYQSFDDFLSTFTSRKRKNVNKERRKVKEQGITIETLEGNQITEQDWQDFYLFYQLTYFKRSGRQGYLTEAFFPLLNDLMSQNIMLAKAVKESETVAAALYFKDSKTLYGRYWGCKEEFDQLHFETCYYQGIEYAIRQKLSRFDPGAQGEHKIQRGFTPITTYSHHYIAHDGFREAIARFLEQEAKHIDQYQQEAAALLPFKTPDQ